MFQTSHAEGWYFVPLGTISRTGPNNAKIGDLQQLGSNIAASFGRVKRVKRGLYLVKHDQTR